ncbi:MAG: hypothetical protein J6Y37_00600, partial [Paludibacteraceae bacterium]|nr:hypothetical protein [Paludibacteraceae bacterium]
KYGNGVETNYGYSANRRRLASLDVVSPKYEGKIMANSYLYDNMDNIKSVINNVTAKSAGNKTIGGFTSHSYDYDEWGRLYKAEGDFNAGAKKAHYNLNMSYDKLYNVTSKKLDLTQENLQFEGSMSVGHELTYQYDENNPFKLLNVNTKEYATDSMKADTLQRINMYDFDANGNQTMASVALLKDSSCLADTAGQQVRQLLWDEDNRLLSINDNGFVSNYFYDANGERTVKLSQPDMAVFVNGASALKNDSSLMKFVGYVSPYLVISNGGKYTKHIYAGTQRIASKLGDIEAFGADPRRVEKAGADIKEIDFGKKYAQQNDSLSSRYDQLGAMNKPEINDDYVGGQSFCCGDKPLAEMPQNAGNSENAQFEENIYFYHPDHLGSTSMVTNIDGKITQNVVYIPYGEVFVEERNGAWSSPYLFNAKELDEETGLYYYGARYLDPTSTRWLSVDPMWEKYMGMSPYNYCAGNPVSLVDPDGRENAIYVIDLQGEKKDIETNKVIEQANKEFENLGLNTRLVKCPVSAEEFSSKKLDNTDSYVVIGSAKQVKDFILKQNPEYEADFSGWTGGECNPERSSNGKTKTHAIGIDAKGAITYAKNTKQEKVKFASFLIEHGVGHNATLDHSSESNKKHSEQKCTNAAIMGGGQWINRALHGSIEGFKNIDDIKTNSNEYFKNSMYVEFLKKHFGDKESKVNYK